MVELKYAETQAFERTLEHVRRLGLSRISDTQSASEHLAVELEEDFASSQTARQSAFLAALRTVERAVSGAIESWKAEVEMNPDIKN